MNERDTIGSAQQRLDLYRRTIAFLLMEREQSGSHAVEDIERQLADTRREILLIKRDLQALGVMVEDHPYDSAPSATEPPTPALAGVRSARTPRRAPPGKGVTDTRLLTGELPRPCSLRPRGSKPALAYTLPP